MLTLTSFGTSFQRARKDASDADTLAPQVWAQPPRRVPLEGAGSDSSEQPFRTSQAARRELGIKQMLCTIPDTPLQHPRQSCFPTDPLSLFISCFLA